MLRRICQRAYTDKIQVIQLLSQQYGADVADTIKAFRNSKSTYEELSYDSVHPNVAGHQLYQQTIADVISGCVKNDKQVVPLVPHQDANIAMFENYEYISLSKMKQRRGTYTLTVNKPTVGIIYKKSPEGQDIHLKMSNGATWDSSAHLDMETLPFAMLVGLNVSSGMKITLDNAKGNIQDTVYGFVVAG